MTRTVTVTPAAQARAQQGGINPTDAQLERAEYELQRALRRGQDTFSLDLPLTPDARAHLEAQGYVLKIKHGRGPAHLQVSVPPSNRRTG
ncbi:hypothetical protein [Deinococcus radiotolerans]|uniref:Uncharacterized protein n=1 Tax=Deinococcus radiotolerans TaxID=1309407 RepID=A0ABQ2FQG0_9DEIO|nr:hypothetical protein [Deinococcus radiotolerans]GGL16606.1 hypothetical protein GCM10010844_39400 [Deinococcus radiotolerans]